MTVVLVDGFDVYNGTGANTGLQANWLSRFSETAGFSMVAGRFTGQGVKCICAASHDWNIYRQLPANYSGVAIGLAMQTTVFPTITPVAAIQLWDTLTAQLGLTVLANGAVQVEGLSSFAASGTILGTSTAGVITLNTWQYIELICTINATTGSYTVYVDGVSVLTGSSKNTQSSANAYANQIMIGLPVAGAGGGTAIFDDLYVNNTNVALGARRVETLYPAADTTQKDFTPDTGIVNYSRVNEAQVVTTNYVQASTVGNADRYTVAPLSGSPTTVDAVQVTAFATKTDVASRSIALEVKSGATISDGSNLTLATTYSSLQRLLTTDPNTSAAWAFAAVNALEVGQKVTV